PSFTTLSAAFLTLISGSLHLVSSTAVFSDWPQPLVASAVTVHWRTSPCVHSGIRTSKQKLLLWPGATLEIICDCCSNWTSMFPVVVEQFVTAPHRCRVAPTHAIVGALRSIDTHGGAWQSTFTVVDLVSVPQSFVTVAVTTYDTLWPAVHENGTCKVQFAV